jgi:hypothetical protein
MLFLFLDDLIGNMLREQTDLNQSEANLIGIGNQAAEEQTDLTTASKNTPQIKQSTEDTRCEQPSNLIPHDKDHADDP